MTSLYIIVALAISQACPNPTWVNVVPASGQISATREVYANGTLNWGSTPSCSCSGDMRVTFSLNKAYSEAELAGGARVWKVSTLPLVITELRRNEVKTYNISEEPVGAKP